MPRNSGTGVYEQPAPDVITATTIESTVYNSFVNDVETDLNTPRPIVAGGTGASSAVDARDELDVEVASAQVTNYDTHVFESGSFWSTAGAVGGPVDPPIGLTGICILAPDTTQMVLFVFEHISGKKWRKVKTSGVWGAWTSEQVEGDARYVNLTGDTMTGDLTLAPTTDPALVLNKLAGARQNVIWGQTTGENRWAIVLGTNHAESSAAVGSNFYINRYDNDGAFITTALSINRDTGLVTTNSGLTINSGGINILADGINVFSGVLTVLKANGAILARSDDAASPTSIGVGRTTNNEILMGVAGVANNYLTGSAAGDGVVSVPAGKLLLGGSGNTNLIFGAGIGRASSFQVQYNITGNTNGICMKGPDTSTTKGFIDFSDSALVQCGAVNVNQSAHTTAFATSSDERAKPNRSKISAPEARNVIDALEVYDFDKDGNEIRGFGVVAQQAYSVHKSLAIPPQQEADFWMVEKAAPVPFLIAALQGANQHIDRLEERLKILEDKLASKP